MIRRWHSCERKQEREHENARVTVAFIREQFAIFDVPLDRLTDEEIENDIVTGALVYVNEYGCTPVESIKLMAAVNFALRHPVKPKSADGGL